MTNLALADYFRDLPDPRISVKCDHRLLDIMVLAICAVLGRAETWEEIEWFGESRTEWLKQWLELPNGIPSHDTIERVFNKLDPPAFQARFQAWVQAVFAVTEGQVVAIDGKPVCGAGGSRGKSNLHLVSAWASANGIKFGTGESQCQIERNHRDPRIAPATGAERLYCYARRHGLPDRDC